MEGRRSLKAYKMLERGAVGPLSRYRWPTPDRGDEPGPWVDAAPNPVSVGIHACHPWQLPIWANDELWEIELAGDIDESEHSVVADSGRLLRRIPAWDGSAEQFSAGCVERARGYGAESAAATAYLGDLPAPGRRAGGVWWARGVPAAWADIAAVAAEAAGGPGRRAEERAQQAAWFEALLA